MSTLVVVNSAQHARVHVDELIYKFGSSGVKFIKHPLECIVDTSGFYKVYRYYPLTASLDCIRGMFFFDDVIYLTENADDETKGFISVCIRNQS